MNGTDFFELAVELSASSKPAHLRSATSRAYYGAFHRAHELLTSFGISLPSGPECHTKVRQLLDHAGDSDVAVANSKLATLRIARNAADYQLLKPEAERKKTTIVNLHMAQQVIDCFELCFAGGKKDVVHGPIRTYAKDVLKLIVS